MAYDDYEQSERVREWLRHNGLSIIVGIVVGLALIFGYRMWQHHRTEVKAETATQFALIRNSWDAGKASEANTLTDSLLANHADSAYAVFAAALRAQHELDNGKTDDAIKSLEWAVAHASSKPLKYLSTIRLARVQLAAGHAQQALGTLKSLPAGTYPGMSAALHGDALVKLGRPDEALPYYQQAMQAYKPDTLQHHALAMKLENLPPAAAKGATGGHGTPAPAPAKKKQDA